MITMKKSIGSVFAILALTALTCSAYAAEDANTNPSDNPENQIKRFSMPSLGDNIYFSGNSDQNAVCKALGYEKAEEGSATVDPKVGVGEAKVLINGTATSGQTDGGAITEILCKHKLTRKYSFKTHNLNSPTEVRKVPYSSKSDPNGVCKVEGYDKALEGSAKNTDHLITVSMVIVDKDGNNAGGDHDNFGVDQVSCIKVTPAGHKSEGDTSHNAKVHGGSTAKKETATPTQETQTGTSQTAGGGGR